MRPLAIEPEGRLLPHGFALVLRPSGRGRPLRRRHLARVFASGNRATDIPRLGTKDLGDPIIEELDSRP